MNDIAPMECTAAANGGSSDRQPIPLHAVILGLFWLVIPMVQYLGALERTEAVVNPTYTPGFLGALDLSPWYVLLLGATILYAGLGGLRRWTRGPGSAGSQEQ